ncbi:hypothetical protein FOZ62_005984 [Perkinsus olseni]|uniref:Uncharacterized protein n=1 Tax=Perkinsus olseni TaxID=32597 RepID=A0A7J6Q675_PEROL|nr:hypothetical protein FOZ62_005984 [Perkinsus olseni]
MTTALGNSFCAWQEMKLVRRGTLSISSDRNSPASVIPTCLALALVPNTHRSDARSSEIIAVISGLSDGGILVWSLRPSSLAAPNLSTPDKVFRSPAVHAGPITSIVVGDSIPAPVMDPGFWLTLFTTSVDRTIKQWHANLSQSDISVDSVVRTIYGNSSAVTCMALFPRSRNRHLVSGCSDGSLTLWTATRVPDAPAGHALDAGLRYPAYERTSTLLWPSKGATSWVMSLAVQDGDTGTVFCGLSSGWVKVFELGSGEGPASTCREKRVSDSPIRRLVLSASSEGSSMNNCDTLFALSSSYSVVGLDLETLGKIFALEVPHNVVSCSRSSSNLLPVERRDSGCVMAWSGGEARLLLGASQDGLCLFDTVKGCQVQCDTEGPLLGPMVDAAFLPASDGIPCLFTLNAAKPEVSVYSITSSERYAQFGETSSADDSFRSVCYLTQIADVRTGVDVGCVEGVDPQTFTCDPTCGGSQPRGPMEVTAMCYLGWCRAVACGMEDGRAFLVPVGPGTRRGGQVSLTRGGAKPHTNSITTICAPRRGTIFCGSYDGSVSCWGIVMGTGGAPTSAKFEGSLRAATTTSSCASDDRDGGLVEFNRQPEEVLCLAAFEGTPDSTDDVVFSGGSAGSVLECTFPAEGDATLREIAQCQGESVSLLECRSLPSRQLFALTSARTLLVVALESHESGGEPMQGHRICSIGVGSFLGNSLPTAAALVLDPEGGVILYGDETGTSQRASGGWNQSNPAVVPVNSSMVTT